MTRATRVILGLGVVGLVSAAAGLVPQAQGGSALQAPQAARPPAAQAGQSAPGGQTERLEVRSEEHTSELQSQR